MNKSIIIQIAAVILAVIVGGLYGYGMGKGDGKSECPKCTYDLLIQDTSCPNTLQKYVVTQNSTAKGVLMWDICYRHTSAGNTPMLEENQVYKVN